MTKNFKFAFIALLIGISASLLIAEIVIRVDNARHNKRRSIWIPDAYLGHRHTKNNRFVYKLDESPPQYIPHSTNRFGLIGKNFELPKPDNVFRILILGDSFTEAMQVSDDRNFCALLEKRLNEKKIFGEKRVEVLNGGMSGFSPISEYLSYKRSLKTYQADLVLLQLFANDTFEDHKVGAMSVLDEEGLPVKLNWYFKKGKEKDLISDFRYNLNNHLVELSRFYEYVYTKSVKWQKKSKYHKRMSATPEFNESHRFMFISFAEAFGIDVKEHPRVFKETTRYVKALRDEVKEEGAQFAMFYIPMEAQMDLNNYSTHVTPFFVERASMEMNEYLRKLGEEVDIEFRDLLPAFDSVGERGLYLDRDGHLAERGHEQVAIELGRLVRQVVSNN